MNLKHRIQLIAISTFSVANFTAFAQQNDAAVAEAVQRMHQASGGAMRSSLSPATGIVNFMSTDRGLTIKLPSFAQANAGAIATKFLDNYAGAFGISGAKDLRVLKTTPRDEVGMEHVRLQQTYNGVPVTGAEFTVHIKENGVASVLAKGLSIVEPINTQPTVSATEARAAVRLLLQKHKNINDASLSPPRLEIFNRGLLEGSVNITRLAWFIEATEQNLREFIWVDAHTGSVLLNFSQLTDAKNRNVYDGQSTATLPGVICRTEGGAVSGDQDCNLAYDYSGDTYDYYLSEHNRDSYDDAGAALISTVHHCATGNPCPYQNAFWNGLQMVYGDGFPAADDVVAHELTHAVTENSANLFYYMQSGALNESYSDIFGEAMDLTNGAGNDAVSVRWDMGEDVPGFGALRDMADPNRFDDPAKMSDSQFICETPGTDGGGVHSNSGVPNRAFALMVDGGTFNAQPVTAIGLTKAGKIQYRALTQYLTSSSDFLDNYYAVQQSCTDLIGTAGITAGNCSAVSGAIDAVEMNDPWPCTPSQAQVPNLCPVGITADDIFFDDLEGGTGNWVLTSTGTNLWSIGNFFATSGDISLYGDDLNSTADSSVEMSSNTALPANAFMFFNHSYGFENTADTNFWDGGVIEYSTNGGASWNDAGSLITAGAGYGGVLDVGNPLGARPAFVSDSFGYTASKLDLSSLAGESVRFRFRIGTDSILGDYGWFVDDIRIYTCATPKSDDGICFPIKASNNKVAVICL